ncbi:MAG: ABC transporter transmembrane domain-containing protein, partial [Planctomycetota bacterium]
MDHFLRALREAWRYWPTLITAFLFSLAAASLWGTNIAALFPIIETTLHGQSIPQWNRQRQQSSEREIAALRAEFETLSTTKSTATPAGSPEPEAGQEKRLALEIEVVRARLWRAEQAYASSVRLGPWLDRYLPASPFQTVVMIVILIACSTAVKQFLAVSSQMMVAYVSQSIARDVRLRIFNRALTLDRPRFNLHGTSGFSANITHTTEMLSSGITAFYHGAFSEPCRILACLAGAFYISWKRNAHAGRASPCAAWFYQSYMCDSVRSASGCHMSSRAQSVNVYIYILRLTVVSVAWSLIGPRR